MIPVSVIAGFLGSGKTTLMNRLLVSDHQLRIAVLVNDFGDIDVDAKLLSSASPDVLSMKNGCVCCSMQADLIAQIRTLAEQSIFDHILIETSGLAEPLNIVRTIQHPQLEEMVYVSGVITLLDASSIEELIGQAKHIVGEQIAAADLVLINKVDLVDGESIKRIRATWSCPGLTMVTCADANVPTELILLDRFLRAASSNSSTEAKKDFEQFVWIPRGPIDLALLKNQLESAPVGLLRSKGFVHSADGKCQLVQTVGCRTNINFSPVDEKPGVVIIATKGSLVVSEWLDLLDRTSVQSNT